MEDTIWILIIPVLLILAGAGVVLMGMHQRTKALEMAHRERLAMIERGMVPTAGETEFTRALLAHGGAAVRHAGPSRRSMTLGILLIGVGLGLGLLIGYAGGARDAAVGVGGAVVMVGAALVVNAVVSRPAAPMPPPAALATRERADGEPSDLPR